MNDDERKAAQRALLDKHRAAQAAERETRRAPLPESVVRGSGVPLATRAMPTRRDRRFVSVARNVDWDMWRNMPTVEIWEAVALSLGNSPVPSSNGSASYYDDEYPKRLRIAKEHLSSQPGSALQLMGGLLGTNHGKVSLSAFRAWAVSLGWTLPPEFPNGATRALSATGDVSKLNEWKAADLWSEADLQALCCGLVPNAGRSATKELNDAEEKIRRAVLAKKLPVASAPVDATAGDHMYGHHRFFEPAAATRWAEGKFPAFPYKASDFEDASAGVATDEATSPSEKRTYLNTIGALLALVLNPRDGRKTQADVIGELIDNYAEKQGIAKSTLERTFAAANRKFNDS
jgi:hypothetical protein